MREQRLRAASWRILEEVRRNHGVERLKSVARELRMSPNDVRYALRFQPSLSVEVREARHMRSGGGWKVRQAWIVRREE